MRRLRPWCLAAALALVAPGTVLVAREGYLSAKARLAAVLVESAWRATLADGRPHRPWRWADMHPVAKVRIPRLGVERPVLSNAAGSALAFGLGRIDGTAAVAGHRDSWGAFLEEIRVGDEVLVESLGGERRYRVTELDVVDRDRADVLPPDGGDELVLVTCWPFGGVVGGRWRYVVRCAGAGAPIERSSPAGLRTNPPQDAYLLRPCPGSRSMLPRPGAPGWPIATPARNGP